MGKDKGGILGLGILSTRDARMEKTKTDKTSYIYLEIEVEGEYLDLEDLRHLVKIQTDLEKAILDAAKRVLAPIGHPIDTTLVVSDRKRRLGKVR